MISNTKLVYSVCLLLLTNLATAGVDLAPRAGIAMNATLGTVAQDSIVLKPDADQLTAVRYRLQSLNLDDNSIDASRLKVKTLYTVGSESLDLYRTFLSGAENSQPVTATFEFEPKYNDKPGIYTGSLSSSSNVPAIPISVNIAPNSMVSLYPSALTITSSNIDAPIINEVSVTVGSNSARWELYLTTENFLQEASEEQINTDRIFVRIKDEINPKPWLALDKQLKIISGVATPVTTIATLEFIVESAEADRAGNYLGNIKFLIRDIN